MAPIDITSTFNTGTIGYTGTGGATSITEAQRNANEAIRENRSGGDRLELSDKGRLLSRAAGFADQLRNVNDIREEKIAEAQRLIDSGELFSKEALGKAAKRLRPLIE